MIYDVGIRCTWSREDFEIWNQPLLDKKRGKGEVKVWFGEAREFELSSIERLGKEFPKQFEKWKQGLNRKGQPSLAISMLERKESFKARQIKDLRSSNMPVTLSESFAKILDAAVARSFDSVADYLGKGVDKTILGQVGAMALREDVRVDEIERVNVRDGDVADQIMIRLTYVDPRLPDRGTARFEFRLDDGNWIMEGFDRQTLNQ